LCDIFNESEKNIENEKDLINVEEMKTKFDLFYMTETTNDLWIYMKKTIPDDSDKNDLPDYTKFVVDKNGNVVKRFSHDESIKDVKETLMNYLNIKMVYDEFLMDD